MLFGPSVDANIAVDIASTIERKAEALACHKSQIADMDTHKTLSGFAKSVAEDTDFVLAESFHLFDVAP
jgi:LmbE family N-acetylglucosaminyl deacetylase